MQKGRTEIEPLVELILQVETHESLTLRGEHRLVFERHRNTLSGIDYALVGDGDYAHGVVDGIVGVFGEFHASGHYHYRPARHVHGVESNLRARRCLIFTRHDEFVLVGILACHNYSGVVQLLINVFVSERVVVDFRTQMRAERLNYREDYLTLRGQYGITLDKVKETVGVALFI